MFKKLLSLALRLILKRKTSDLLNKPQNNIMFKKLGELLKKVLSKAKDVLPDQLENLTESKLIELLNKVREEDPEEYKAALFGLHSFTKRVRRFTDETENKFDDAIVDGLHEACHESARLNGEILND